ncbi:MAG TPA: hypothetical protein VH643_02810 [Gemmataceae bacterium]
MRLLIGSQANFRISERWPWLVYVVLSVASIVLLILLFLLGREANTHHDRTRPAPGPST